MTNPVHPAELDELARLYGVLPAYTDVHGVEHHASVDSLLSVLHSVGAPVLRLDDVADALNARQRRLWQRLLEPVVVSWDGEPLSLRVRLPASALDQPRSWRATLQRETPPMTGSQEHPPPVEESVLEGLLEPSAVIDTAELAGERYVAAKVTVPHALPVGYHALRFEVAGQAAASAVFVAPRRCWSHDNERLWGVFMPTWATHHAGSLGGVGDFGALQGLQAFVAEHGGHIVATLPMMATFLEDAPLPFDPSPYMPVSRLAWNEMYLDFARLPELAACEPARRVLGAAPAAANLAHLRSSGYVDWRRLADVRQAVLREIADWFFRKETPALAEFEAWIDRNPRIADYARFRALHATQKQPWRHWPEVFDHSDVDERTLRYHVYAQWRAQVQMDALDDEARQHGPGLLLDMPLGVHPDGYDAWRERGYFLDGCSTGAPPDLAHKNGQDWGFAPLNPTTLRDKGYRYLIDCLRFQIKNAGILRIDHVMGLHRIWCIPQGMGSPQGVYVRYRPEEVYAILAIESHRHHTMICGEDLGTVPPEVPEAMQRHNVLGLKIVQRLAVKLPPEDLGEALATLPERVVAGVNTHDMPTFAGFIEGSDLRDSEELGLLGPEQVAAGRENRPRALAALHDYLVPRGRLAGDAGTADRGPSPYELVSACLEDLAASDARVVLVSLEDLWEEDLPQNVPGTVLQRPNWRRRAACSLEEMARDPRVLQALRRVAAARAAPARKT